MSTASGLANRIRALEKEPDRRTVRRVGDPPGPRGGSGRIGVYNRSSRSTSGTWITGDGFIGRSSPGSGLATTGVSALRRLDDDFRRAMCVSLVARGEATKKGRKGCPFPPLHPAPTLRAW